MTILFIDQYSDPGGAQRCLLDVARGVVARGWRAHAAVPGGGSLVRMLRESGVEVSQIRCGPLRSGRKSAADAFRFAAQFPVLYRQISRLLESCSPDVVYVNGPRPLPAACAAARGSRVIFHAHSLLTTPFDAIVSRSLGLPTVVRVIAGSRYVARPLLDRLPPGTVHVIYNGVPDCSGPLTGNGCGRIGVLGRISPEKGQLEFLQAARLLAAEKTGVRFVICGEPLFSNGARYYGRVRDAARGLPVEFYGWRENVSELLSQLDLLVVPSTGPESTTRVVLDAFSAGVPVVAFATGGIPEVIEDGRTGFLVGETSPEALAAAIGDLLGARQEEARAAASRARVEWRRRFTVQRFEEQVLAEIEELASAPRPVGVH